MILSKETYAIDVETYSKSGNKEDNLNPFKNKVRCISISDGENKFVLDTDLLSKEVISSILNKLFKKQLVFHNAKFDILTLMNNYQLPVPKHVCDTMLLANILNNATLKEGASLKEVSKNHLNIDMDKTLQSQDWGQLSLSFDSYLYSGVDVVFLIKLMHVLVEKINNLYSFVFKEKHLANKPHWTGLTHFVPVMEMEFLVNLIKIEYAGIPLNEPYLENLLKETNSNINKYTTELQNKYGIKNPNSPKQLLEFFSKEGINIDSTAEDKIKDIDHPVIDTLLQLRSQIKMKGMLEGYLDAAIDNRIHPSFNQLVTTGRMSCRKPNVQQIPRELKDNFYKGHIIKKDYPAIELRILASYLKKHYNDDTMVNIFKREDADPHKVTASLMFGKTEEEVTKEERQAAKAVNFGLSYGMGAEKFKDYAKGYGLNLSVEEAQSFKDKFLKAYPSLREWHNSAGRAVNYIKNAIHIKTDDTIELYNQVTTLAGRIIAADKYNDMLNYPIQGTGGDITKYAVNIFYKLLEEYEIEYLADIINIVHDEIIVEVYSDNENDIKLIDSLLSSAMSISADFILKYFNTKV
jgi:DNA polymerase-1